MPGIAAIVFKVRAKNTDSRKGSSGGYRLIYQCLHPQQVVLITIYTKTEQSDITPTRIGQLIHDYAAQSSDDESA